MTYGPKDITCFLWLFSLCVHTCLLLTVLSAVSRGLGMGSAVFALGSSLLRTETNEATEATRQGLGNFKRAVSDRRKVRGQLLRG